MYACVEVLSLIIIRVKTGRLKEKMKNQSKCSSKISKTKLKLGILDVIKVKSMLERERVTT